MTEIGPIFAAVKNGDQTPRGKHMLRFSLALTGTALLAGAFLNPGEAAAQTVKSRITGAWTLVSIEATDKDGKTLDQWGANPKGIQVLHPSGQFVQIISRSDVPKFAVNNRAQGTPAENTAAMKGITANF